MMHSDQDPNSSDYEEVKDSDLPQDDLIVENKPAVNPEEVIDSQLDDDDQEYANLP